MAGAGWYVVTTFWFYPVLTTSKGYNSFTKKLEIVTTANQDPLISTSCPVLFLLMLECCVAHTPIIGVDIWEHVSHWSYILDFRLLIISFYRLSTFRQVHSVLKSVISYQLHFQYKNVKADVSPYYMFIFYMSNCLSQYLGAIWNVINFKEAEKRLLEA